MNPDLWLLVYLNKIKSVKSIAYFLNNVLPHTFHQKSLKYVRKVLEVFSGMYYKPVTLGLSEQHGSLKNRF